MTSIYINWFAIIWFRIIAAIVIIYFVVLGRTIKRQWKQRKHTKLAVKMITSLDLVPMELELKDVNCEGPTTK